MKCYMRHLNTYDKRMDDTMQFDETKICSTLGETSEDDNGNRVIDSDIEVYDFDEVTKEIADIYRAKKPVKSCDALYIKDDTHIYLIEFKNTRKSNMRIKELKQKAFDSILSLAFSFFPRLSLDELKERVSLIVVYNNDAVSEKEQKSEHFQLFKNKLEQFSRPERTVLFGLKIYEDVLYKEVITVEKDIFMQEIYDSIFKTTQSV